MGTPIDLGGNDLIVDGLRVGATAPGQAGTTLTGTEITLLDGLTAGTVTASKAVTVNSSKAVTGFTGITSNVAGVVAGFIPTAVQQAINANGAINITSYYTAVTSVSTTGQTFTLADGTITGQLKKIQLIVDGADATVTFNSTATIVFADAGDVAVLIWNGSDWIPIELSNDADGATAPVYTPAS